VKGRCAVAFALGVLGACAAPGGGDDRDLAIDPPDLSGDRDLSAPPDLARDLAAPPDLMPPALFSFGSPGVAPVFWMGNLARPHKVTLAADDPAARIYYTTDGTPATTSSQNALTPITGIMIAQTTTLRWFATSAAGMEPAHMEVYGMSTALQASAGYVVEDVALDGTSPTITATAGQVLAAARATWQIWVQTACPGCRAQLVYGVDGEDQGCLYDQAPGLYPGVSGTAATFTVTAPMTAGYHEVRVAHIEQTSCAAALAAKALTTRPTVERIAVIYVK
jgi:hypothetical protein